MNQLDAQILSSYFPLAIRQSLHDDERDAAIMLRAVALRAYWASAEGSSAANHAFALQRQAFNFLTRGDL